MPCPQLAFGEDVVAREELDHLGLDQRLERLGRCGGIGQTALGGLLAPGLAVVVAVEEDALVLADKSAQHALQCSVEGHTLRDPGLERGAEFVDAPGHEGVEGHVGAGAALERAYGAQLELVAGEGQWRGAVAVGRVARQCRYRRDAGADRAAAPARAGTAVHDLREDVRELLAQIYRDDGGRRLMRAEAVVVAGGGDRRAQQVGELVDAADNGGQHGQEDGILMRRLAWAQPVAAVGTGGRPVVVLARAVDAGEGFLVEQAEEAVARGDLLQHEHRQHVVVNGQVLLLEDRRHLELRGSRLVVAHLGGDAETPERLVHLVHEGQHARLDVAEVVILHLLLARRGTAEERPACHLEVGTQTHHLQVYQEILLLGTQCGVGVAGVVDTEEARHALELGLQGALRA